MKNQLLFILLLLGLSLNLMAQEPEKEVKKADKLVGLYLLDPKSSKDKLMESKAVIDGIYKDPAVANLYKTSLVRGKVYNELAAMDNALLILNSKSKLNYPDATIICYESLEKAITLAVKSYEKKDALDILQECSQYMNNYGSSAYNAQKFDMAFKNFEAVLKTNKLLVSNGQKAILLTPDDVNKQKYIVGVCALSAKNEEMSAKYFEELEASNYNDTTNAGAIIYESLYNYYLAKDSVKAEKFLNSGRTKFPNESNLLFAEINSYLKKGKLAELIDKLKLAISKEPNNVSIYSTMGNVYDNLCQKEWEAGNMAKGDEYQMESMKYYDVVLEKEPKNANALYSKGALYYNKAALISKEANKFANDYSKEGTKKYNEKKAEMDTYFDKALPLFEMADQIEGNDVNTLVALKEIYAKKSMFDKSNAIKARLEALKK